MAIDIRRVGHPQASGPPVLEQREILTAVPERPLEERGDVRFRDPALLLPWHQWLEIQEPAQRPLGIRASPHGIELAVIGAIGVDLRLEPRAGSPITHVVPLPA